MSGSYATTPNFALKKPVTGADDDLWGTHWNQNADTLDATLKVHGDALAGVSGGPFLPMVGGNLSGPGDLGVGGTLNTRAIVQTASNAGGTLTSSVTPGFQQNVSFTGANAAASIVALNQWNVAFDTLAKTGQLLFHTAINYNYGGGGTFTGGRGGLLINMVQTGAVAASPGSGGIEAIQASVSLTNTFGGTNLTTSPGGAVTCFNPFLTGTSGFKNGYGGSGAEFNFGMAAGSSYRSITGLALVQTSGHKQNGAVGDTAIFIGNQTGTTGAWFTGIVFGGTWPLTPDGTMFAARHAAVSGGNTNVGHGIDIQEATIAGAAFRSVGFSVDGPTGNIRTGTLRLNNLAAGGSIDASGAVATAVALAVAARGFPTDGNAHYATDSNGGVYSLAMTGGAVTGVTMLNAPVVSGASPANPFALTPDKTCLMWGAAGLTVNLTWDSTRTALAIQPTAGGKLGFNGATPVVKPTVTGSKGANAALASLLTALANYGIITDSST